MSKKDYEKAATIAQDTARFTRDEQEAVIEAFIDLFNDNERFDEARFRAACIPGANVKARPRKAKVAA